MILLLPLLITISSLSGFAQIKFTPTQKILMSGESCRELDQYALDIAHWARESNKDVPTSSECFCSSQSCQIDVLPISPYFVKALTNFNPEYMNSSYYPGPNCFNAALVSTKTLDNVTFTHPFEMTAVLNSPLCKERSVSEPALSGDILVVRDQSNSFFEIHAGVYINEHLAFSKYGESSAMPYSYGFNVDKAYGVRSENCRRIEGTPSPGDDCYGEPYVNIFTCKPLYQFVSQLFNSDNGLNESVQKIYAKTTHLNLTISGIVFDGSPIKIEHLEVIQTDLRELYFQSLSTEKHTSLSKENKVLLQLMKFRVYSLFEQTRRIALKLNAKPLAIHELPRPQLLIL